MLEFVEVGQQVEFWPAQTIRNESPEDAERIDDEDMGVLFHSGNGDGALVIGSPQGLADLLERLAAQIRAMPRTIEGEVVVEFRQLT